MNKKLKTVCLVMLLGILCITCEKDTDSIAPHVETEDPAIAGLDFDEEEARTFQYPVIRIKPLNDRKPLDSPMLHAAINKFTTAEEGLTWENVDDYTLWSAINAGGNYVAVGFKKPDTDADGALYQDQDYVRYNRARNYTIEFVLRQLRALYPGRHISLKDLEIKVPQYLPLMWMKIPDYEVIAGLRKLPSVRYVEPATYQVAEEDHSSDAAKTSSIPCIGLISNQYQTPFTNRGYNSKVSWHLYAHNIPAAWAVSTGRQAYIGIIDTGIDPDQDLLKEPKFNTGLSSGRYISKYNLIGNLNTLFLWHGTAVSGVAAGPVNNDGAITGVAYNASLISYRISADPLLQTNRSRENFVEALEALANRSTVRVINMSNGTFERVGSMEDAVNYAHSRGKLLVCSSGITGRDGGVYPARFQNTLAVTCVKYDAAHPTGLSLEPVAPNPYGSYIDFAAYIQRKSDNACALSLSGNGSNPRPNIGSSIAAATVTGIATLVWSANPYLTRDEVLTILRNAASYQRYVGVKHIYFGYGVIDALKAVNDAKAIGPQCRDLTVSINGPTRLGQNVGATFTAKTTGGCSGSTTYKWYNSLYGTGVVSTSPSYTARFYPWDTRMTIRLELTRAGITRTASKIVTCTDCTGGPGGGDCDPHLTTTRTANGKITLVIEPCPLAEPDINSSANDPFTVQITDKNQKVIYTQTLKDGGQTLLGRQLDPGVYTLELIHRGRRTNRQTITVPQE